MANSFRGVKFTFSEGEKALCFEPDPTKAKVLYEAKILDISVGRDKNGKRVPEYLVHFYGWNSSWDRIVGEDHIQKWNEENIDLMRRLADVVKGVKKNKARKKKIDEILGVHDRSGSEEDDRSEDDSEEGTDNGSEETEGNSSDLETLDESDEEEENQAKEVIIEIPDLLKKKLENDCSLITVKNKRVKLPAEPNVNSILEGYVKNYAFNILCGTMEKTRSSYSAHHRIQLCKEVMDGLRIFFDFLLPTHLLYSQERNQYKKIISSFRPDGSPGDHQPLDSVPEVSSPRRRTRHTSASESAPKLIKLSPRVAKKDKLDVHHQDKEDTPRRLTRHAAAEEVIKNQSVKKLEGKAARHKVDTSSVRATPPPPLLIPNAISNKVTSGRSTPVKAEPCGGQSENEAVMNEVLSWRLVPDNVLLTSSCQPSQIYGCHHLLRLFAKLPEFLSLMKIPDMKLRTLLRYFDNLLEYIGDRHSEFLPNDSYTVATETTKHAGKR